MEALYWLIPIALGVMIVMVVAFIYTVKNGQYDDLEGPAHRILMDDDDPRIPGQQHLKPDKTFEGNERGK